MYGNVWDMFLEYGEPVGILKNKQDEAHEPECSHVCQWYRCQNTWLCSDTQYLSAIVYLE